VSEQSSNYSLPSVAENKLVMRLVSTNTGKRAFVIAGPTENNSIPTEIRDIINCSGLF
jgi:hypothetical protein